MKSLTKFITIALLACPCSAYTLRVDFDDNDDASSTTQSGWTAVTQTGGANLGGTGIVLTITAVGSGVTIDDRVRTTNGGGTEFDLWEDFIFANGSDLTTDGMDLVFTGLLPNRTYPVALWMFDKGSPVTRTALWNGQSYSFNGSDAAPATLNDKRLNLMVATDASGTLTIQGRAVATGQLHNVYVNGLEIGDLPETDSDNDAMPDSWESEHGLTVGINDAGLDLDADHSTNLNEFLNHTDPQDSDTDNDSLVDGYESNSGRWLSSTNTGTNPLVADSDSDGLTDGLENPDLPRMGPAQPGTDPNLPDTDHDGLLDGVETGTGIFVSPSDTGTNPTNPDADGDGLRDGIEVGTYHTDPFLADTDGDGFDDLFEANTGFNPISAQSTPDLLSAIRPAREFRFNAANGVSYRIEGSPDTQKWTILETGIVGGGNVVSRFYSEADLGPRYFLRARRN